MSESPLQVEAALSAPSAAGNRVDPALRVTLPEKRRIRLPDIWTSRRVGWMLGWRDMTAKYKQSALGPLWLVLQPLGMLAAISIAFSQVTSVNTGEVLPGVMFATGSWSLI